MRKKSNETTKGTLSIEEENILRKNIDLFSTWLKQKKIINEIRYSSENVELPAPSTKDWLMKVKDGKISFNTNATKKCSFDFFQLIVLHEFFHVEVQKVPNKEDAVRIKDDFGDVLMTLIDIEADYFTALFFKEKLGYEYSTFLELLYEGGKSKLFSDSRIRNTKFERYLGMVLSIGKMFLDKKNRKSFDLYLPTISPVYTEQSLDMLVVRKEHIYFVEIKAEYDDFKSIKMCYTDIENLSKKGYVETISGFVSKALQLPIPAKFKQAIEKF